MATAKIPQPEPPGQGARPASRASIQGHAELTMLRLDDQGIIRDCGAACGEVFGYPPVGLIGRHVSILLPQLPETDLVEAGRINTHLACLCRCGLVFQARHHSGRHFSIELFVNRLDAHNVAVLMRRLHAHGTTEAVGRPH